jgi:glycosyltransferase involved in cell wall biosynthesis
MNGKFKKLRIGVMLDGTDPLGGVTSWAEDLARHKPDDIEIVAIILLPIHPSRNASSLLNTRWFSKTILLHLSSSEQEHWQLECRPRLISTFHHLVNEISREIDAIIPNHLEIGYKIAAALGTQGRLPIVIGICHTDETYYYHLISKYRHIISLTIAVCSESVPKINRIFRNCSLIPYGVALDVPSASSPPMSDSAPFRVVYVGRLVERQKRISRLIDLAQQLSVSGAYELTIIGSGEEYQHLSNGFQEIRSASPHFCYQFAGALPRQGVAAALSRASAFVLVSEAEGTPISMLEAMAARVVPVVPSIAGIKDVIDHGKNGFLYPEGATGKAASIIRHLKSHPIERLEIATRARETVVESYGVRRRIGQLFSAIRSRDVDAAPSPEAALTALRDERMMQWGNDSTIRRDNSELVQK